MGTHLEIRNCNFISFLIVKNLFHLDLLSLLGWLQKRKMFCLRKNICQQILTNNYQKKKKKSLGYR